MMTWQFGRLVSFMTTKTAKASSDGYCIYSCNYETLAQSVSVPNPLTFPAPSTSAHATPDFPAHRQDFLLVNYWTKQEWNEASKHEDTMEFCHAGHPKRGTSQGVNVTMRYVEDESGQMIDGHKASAIHKMACSIWAAFVQHGKAPTKWSQADIVVLQSYQREMQQHFPELPLCENNWKAEQIAIDNYPLWRTHYHGTKVKQESSNSSDINLLNPSEAASPPTKQSQPHSKKNFFPATKKA